MQKSLMVIKEFDDAVFFRIACECGIAGHDVELSFENEDGFLTMRLAATTRDTEYRYRSENKITQFFCRVFWRIQTAAKVLLTGKVETWAEIALAKDNLEAFEVAIAAAKERIP